MFAVFFEAEKQVHGHPQWLIFPTGSDSHVVYHRTTDGGKGGLNRWRIVNHITSDLRLTAEPTAVVVTDSDWVQYQSNGLPSTLTSKALKAHLRAGTTDLTTTDMNVVVREVNDRSDALNRWIRDERRVRPVVMPSKIKNTPVIHVGTATEPAPQAQMAFIPEKNRYKNYVHRSIDGVEDFAVLDFARAQSRNVLLYGPTGPGKTTCALAYAAHHGLHVAMVNGSAALEPSHYLGKTIQDENTGRLVWQDGIITQVVRSGGMILLDEAGFISNKIITPLFPLLQYGTRHLTLLDHKGETIKAHPDLLIVATMNPNYSGNQDLNEALRNRYAIQIEWGYDDNVERVLVKSKALRVLAQQLRVAELKGGISTPTPTNALTEFVEIAEGIGVRFAFNNFISRYREDEKEIVKAVLDTHRAGIEADLGGTVLASVEVEEEAGDFSGIDLSNITL